MKKFIALIATLVGVLGCAKITDGTIENKDIEIAFATNTNNPDSIAKTRAIVTTDMADNFGVYGYVVPGTYSTLGGYLMKNAEYEETGSAANGAHYYWPKSQNNDNVDIIFTAYSQYAASPAFNTTTGELTLTLQTLTQALINNPSNFNDVLWAQTKTNHQNANVGATHTSFPLNFAHALSWVRFRAEVATNASIKYVNITEIKFTDANGDAVDGLYTDGSLVLPTKAEIASTPTATYTGSKTTTFDFCPTDVRLEGTSYSGDHEGVLSDVLVIPQPVPVYVSIVYDICISNETGDEVLISGRRITRQINTGNDADGAHTYTSAFQASHKYVYNFRINVEEVDFIVTVDSWDTNTHEYHVWDYTANAYIEHFFDKALIMRAPNTAGVMA